MLISAIKKLLGVAAFSLTALTLCGQVNLRDPLVKDSVAAKTLPGVTVSPTPFSETIPAQKLTGRELKSLNAFSVADVIRYFAGIQVKDYGGIGGLKTVDMRSMGTHHLGVFYDGIQLGNAQNGQIDLGKFSMDNMESISLYNGQKSDLLQPAKDFGSSGVIYLRSRKPSFDSGQTQKMKLGFKTGSFDLLNPSLLWEQKLTQLISLSFSSEWVKASGRYPFRYKRVFHGSQQLAWDTTAIRQNGAIEALRVEGGLHGVLKGGHWNGRAYFYDADKGIPGAIVNNVWKRSQRQWDRNFFLQGSFQKKITTRYDLLMNAKYAHDYLRYLNPDTTLMYINNRFTQQEFYGSVANKYVLNKNLALNLSTDLQWNRLQSNLEGFVFPQRLTTLMALAISGNWDKLTFQTSVLATLIHESLDGGNRDSTLAAPSKQEFTPAVFISFKPFPIQDFSIRTFYKNIFRMPTFNDLYYTDIGNIYLKPEFTHQWNLGFLYVKNYNHTHFKKWQLQADGYYNQVTNKIIAVPKGNGMYRWMMMNLGYVEIRGVDLVTDGQWVFSNNILLNIRASYTYQQAQDFTKRKNPDLQKITYGGQIPYIPWHSGSLIGSVQFHSWRFHYSFIYVGERYHNAANIPENYEQPWYTSDCGMTKTFKTKKTEWKLSAELNNLFSQDYEVVLNYPMPKRNFKLMLSLEL